MENLAYKVKKGSLEQFETTPVFVVKGSGFARPAYMRIYIDGRVEYNAGFCGPRAPEKIDRVEENNFFRFADFFSDARIR